MPNSNSSSGAVVVDYEKFMVDGWGSVEQFLATFKLQADDVEEAHRIIDEICAPHDDDEDHDHDTTAINYDKFIKDGWGSADAFMAAHGLKSGDMDAARKIIDDLCAPDEDDE